MFAKFRKATGRRVTAEPAGDRLGLYQSVFARTVDLMCSLGIEISDMNGHVDEVSERVNRQAELFTSLRDTT